MILRPILQPVLQPVLRSPFDRPHGKRSPPRLPTLGVVGDSITSFETDMTSAYSRYGPGLAGDRLAGLIVSGAGGYTLEQIRTLLLPEVIAWGATHVLLAGGTNDMNGTVADAQSALLALIVDTVAAGCTPILWAPPPRRASETTVNVKTSEYASWVRSLAASTGYMLLDAHTILADPDTGALPDSLSGDAVHPNRAGHAVLGEAFGDLLRAAFTRENDIFLTSQDDSALTASWGLFLTDSNGDGRADGVGGYGTYPTMALVPGAPAGNWQETSGAAGVAVPSGALRVDVTGIVAGATYEVAYAIEADLSGFIGGPESFAGVYCSWRDSSAQIAGGGQFGGIGGLGGGLYYYGTPGSRIYVVARATAPEGADRLRIDMVRPNGLTPTTPWYARFAQMTVRQVS